MGRYGVAGVAALCGAFAAGPSLAVATGSPNSLILVYLSQLPLFIGGLWLGAGAAVLAGLTASLMLLAASNILAALMFATLNVVPVILLVRQALLARVAATGGAVEWYPPGLLAVWLTGLGLTAIAVAFLVFGGPEGIRAAVNETLAPALDRLFEQNAHGRDELANLLAMIMPGLVTASWMAMTLINGTLAQGLLARFGASWRPSPALGALSLPIWFPVLPVLAALATALGETMRFLGINVMIVLTVPFCLAGLALLHAIAYRFSRPAILLVAFYVVAGLFGWPLLLATVLGLIDTSFRLRRHLPLVQSLGENK